MQEQSPANTDSTNSDRRRLFRLPQQVTVQYQLISGDPISLDPYHPDYGVPTSFALQSELYRLEVAHRHLLRGISAEFREIALYLSGLNQKIELLARTLCAPPPAAQLQEIVTDLSEGGLSFQVKESLPRGQLMHLLVHNVHGGYNFAAIGSVVHSRQENDHYALGIEFVALLETDRQAICRYLMRRQVRQDG